MLRLLRNADDGQWSTAAKQSVGRFSYSCASPHFAVFLRNEAISIVRWNGRESRFEQVEFACDVFTGPMHAYIWADRVFYLKLDHESCSLRSFSLTEAFVAASSYVNKRSLIGSTHTNESSIIVPQRIEDVVAVSTLPINIPGHVADLKFSVYTSPSMDHPIPPTFPSSASIFIIVLIRPEPRSAPAYFIALNSFFTPALPLSDQWTIVARSEPQIHPEFGVDGMYLYVELLSRMSKRGWLLVNLMKRYPERAGFIRVRALIVPTLSPSSPSSNASPDAAGTGSKQKQSASMSIFYPRLPDQLREHYLPNIPLKATEGVENFLEEYSGAMVYITTRDAVEEGGAANVVEIWYPDGRE